MKKDLIYIGSKIQLKFLKVSYISQNAFDVFISSGIFSIYYKVN